MKTILNSRRHQYLVMASIFLITVALIAGMVGCGDGNGFDPYADYIKIYDWTDLDNIRNNLVAKYVLMNDLDSTTAGYMELASPTANGGEGWQPIGTEHDIFTGTFDGQGYEIRDLFIDRPSQNLIGLFGFIDEEGVIANIGVVDAYVVGDIGTGCLAGGNAGTITNSYATGSVAGNSSGCLLGGNGGTVSYCYSTGSVTGDAHVGCLVGANGYAAVISNSYSTGNATGGEIVGGLVGLNEGGSVSNSYSTGSADGVSFVGGLVGVNAGSGNVSDSFWDTETSGLSDGIGGGPDIGVTGKTTAEMQNIITFSGAMWDIVAVANPSIRNPSYLWNIVDDMTYAFLSWES